MSLAVGTTDAALVVVVVVVVLLLLLLVDDDRWKLARARRSAAPGPVGCGGGGKEEDEEDDDAAEKDDAAEEAEEDEEEEPSLAASALSMASDNTWSNGSIGSLRLAESLSGTALISLSDITLKSWPGRCHWSSSLPTIPSSRTQLPPRQSRSTREAQLL